MNNELKINAQPLEEGSGLPESIAYHRLNSEIVGVFKHLHAHFWARSILMSVFAVVVCGLGLTFLAPAAQANHMAAWNVGFGIMGAAGFASVLAMIGIYPVLHKGEGYIHQTASIISHANIELFSLLGKLTELRGGDTPGHTLRVTVCTMLFAEALGLPREAVLRSVKGALLHDIGKLVIPDRVICKPGKLTDGEREEMKQHVVRGLEIIDESGLLSAAVNVVGFHHERYDGAGYPHGMPGEKIPLEARLFTLIDVFDALTAQRIYKAALTPAEALDIMAKERGSHFDPHLFDRFIEMAPHLEAKVPREEGELKVMLLAQLTPYLDGSEISYLRGKLLTAKNG